MPHQQYNTVEIMYSPTSSPCPKAPCAQMHRRYRIYHCAIGNATLSQEMLRWHGKRCRFITPCKDNTKNGARTDHSGYRRPLQERPVQERRPLRLFVVHVSQRCVAFVFHNREGEIEQQPWKRRALGPAFCLGEYLLRFPAVALLHLISPLRLFVTHWKRRDG